MSNYRAGLPFCFLICLLLAGRLAIAQPLADTLRRVEVTDRRGTGYDPRLERYAPGQKVLAIDSQILERYRQQSLAVLLAQQLPVFVKSYGFNSLATLNFRGSSAAQSQVLWEGVPLQNAASGIADVSLLPVMLVDKVSIVYGSSAALWGSGNVGGALLLESRPPVFDTAGPELLLTAGAGSFHQYQAGLKAAWHARRWSADLRAFGQEAKNDFPYAALNGEDAAMTNARLRSGSILSRVAYRPDDHNVLTMQGWLQQYDRQLPPALFESSSVKEQRDGAARFLVQWKHQHRRQYYVKAAYLQDRLVYDDSAIRLHTDALTRHYYAEGGWEQPIGPGRLLIFAPVQLLTFTGNREKQQVRAALAGAFTWRRRQVQVALNARGEAIDGRLIFLPGLNASWKPVPWLGLKANVQRTYRAPTLNELYFNPGGNPDLLPESGWHADGGYTVSCTIGSRARLEHGLSGFSRYIRNWIIWYGGAIWTPHNIAAVHSRGLESENRLTVRTGGIQWQLGVNGAYTLATTAESVVPNDNSIGRQIPYAPRISLQGSAGLAWRKWAGSYNHAYTGKRYITTDESQELSGYQTGNLQLSYTAALRRWELRLNLQCQNIWNATYEVVGFRPVPGINWLAGVTVGYR